MLSIKGEIAHCRENRFIKIKFYIPYLISTENNATNHGRNGCGYLKNKRKQHKMLIMSCFLFILIFKLNK